MPDAIQAHNQRSATVWSSGGAAYDRISRGIADSIEHAVVRLKPQPGERTLDLATWLPDSNVFKMFLVMKRYMAAPPQPAPPSPFDWGRPERVAQLIGAPFDLRFERGTSMYREPDGEHAWETFVNGHGPTKMLAASLDEEKRAALQRDFVDFPDAFADELSITVPRGYLVTLGTRR